MVTKSGNSGRNKHLWLQILITLLLVITPLWSQDSLQLAETKLEIESDSLQGIWGIHNLVSGDIRQTLLSGLPILIEIQPELLREEQASLPRRPRRYSCQYDIWEDRYIIETAGKVYQLNSIKAFNNWWQQPPPISFFAIKDIRQQVRLRLKIRVNIVLLAKKRDRQLKSWVLNSSQKEEKLPSTERDTGFTLNLNALLSIFIDKDAPLRTYRGEATSSGLLITQSPARP